jgi:hypothetical protein
LIINIERTDSELLLAAPLHQVPGSRGIISDLSNTVAHLISPFVLWHLIGERLDLFSEAG